MKKTIFILGGIVVSLLLVGTLFGNMVLKPGVEAGVSLATGFKTTIGHLAYRFPSTINIRDLKIKNPKGFKKEYFADIPEIYVDFNLMAALKKESIHLPEVRLNVQQINIEKTKDGVSNLEKLTSLAPAEKKEAKKPEKKGEALPFQLDNLDLTMRMVSFEDRSSKIPKKLSADLNVKNEVIKDINSPLALVNILVLKVMYGTTFGNLGINVGALEGQLKETWGKGSELLKTQAGAAAAKAEEAAKQAQEAAKQTADKMSKEAGAIMEKTKASIDTEAASKQIQDATAATTEKLGDAAGAAKEKLGSLFGKAKG